MDLDSLDSYSMLMGESLADSKEQSVPHMVEEEESEEGEIDPTKLFTVEQLAHLKHLFETIDVAKRNRIHPKYIAYVLRYLGLNPTKAEIRRYIHQADPDKKGLVSFIPFITPLYQKINHQPETHEDIIAAFESFDEEELQYLTVEYLSELLTTYGEEFDDIELEIFLKAADPKNTGKVYYREFVEKMFGITKKTGKKQKKKDKEEKDKSKKKPKPKK